MQFGSVVFRGVGVRRGVRTGVGRGVLSGVLNGVACGIGRGVLAGVGSTTGPGSKICCVGEGKGVGVTVGVIVGVGVTVGVGEEAPLIPGTVSGVMIQSPAATPPPNANT